MKKHLFLVAALATLSLIGFASRAQAQQEDNISFQVFYDTLAPYGEWINVEGYGYCWRPSVDEDWAPYTDGSWAYTDAGWTWCGNEEWSWAPYHYGRWTQLQNLGWVWVPGYEWAPAWVSWRYGDEYVGWAPLPPTAVWVADVGFNTTIDVECGITPSYYSFCPVQYFGAPLLRPCILPYWNNAAIINHTRNVTRIARNGNSLFIYSGGPNFAEVNQRVQHPFQQLRLEPQRNVDPSRLIAGQGRNHLQNNVLQVVAPTVVNATAQPRNIAAEIPRQQVVHPVDRIPPRHQGNAAANPVSGQNAAPPTAVSTSQPEPLPSDDQGNQNGHGHYNRPNYPIRPSPPASDIAAATPTPRSGILLLPGTTPVVSAPVAPTPVPATGNATPPHRLIPRPHPASPQESAQEAQPVSPSAQPGRPTRPGPAAQQQGAQQQATQPQPTQQQIAQQQAARQQAAQQRAAQLAAQQQLAQQQAAQQQQQQQQVPQQPQQQPAPGGYNPGGLSPGSDGRRGNR